MQNICEGLPQLIQAGMGAHISSAHLACATSRLGALGVVSGVGLRYIVIEEVRRGDEIAIELAKTFPIARYVEELLSYAPGGSRHTRPSPMDVVDPRRADFPRRLAAIAAYVEVMRARIGHRGQIGINVMWKATLTVLPTIYGALYAGVDALLCGAGVPMELPDIVNRFRSGMSVSYPILTGTGTAVAMDISEDNAGELLADTREPHLLPILSNFAFAKRMLDSWMTKYGHGPSAFVLENHEAGGHNAPPRDKVEFGASDDIDSYFDKVRKLGVPIFVAGAFRNGGTREDLLEWQSRGAYGIQVGSRFALCTDSGMRDDLRSNIVAGNQRGETQVKTSNRLSPTGYPLKFVEMPGTLSDPKIYEARPRLCNRGYLLQSHFEETAEGATKETYICPAMPAAQYLRLGGSPEEVENRICLCNALIGTAGLDDRELALITLGKSGSMVKEVLNARQVVESILTPEAVAEQERILALDGPPLEMPRLPEIAAQPESVAVS